MKHLKKFENSNIDIKYGYFVYLLDSTDSFSTRYNDFLDEHIGKVLEVCGNFIYVKFIFNDDDSASIKNEFSGTQVFNFVDIKYYAKTLEDVKLKKESGKYNL